MKKTILAVVIILIIGVGLYFARDFIPSFGTKQGQLQVQTRPAATLFINGENSGVTPFDQKLDPADYELRLVPENEETTSTWQQTVTVNEGLETFVRVYLGDTAVTSSWEIITLEKIGRGETEVTIFSQTDETEIYFDGELKGSTPLSFQEIEEGEHEIRLISPGFEEKTIEIVVTPGYKLEVSAQLALVDPDAAAGRDEDTDEENEEADSSETESDTEENEETDEEDEDPTPTPQEEEAEETAVRGDTIIIASPETGWLRVREEATKSSSEVTKVDDGEAFVVLDVDSGWYEIEYDEDGNTGWISSDYTTLQ